MFIVFTIAFTMGCLTLYFRDEVDAFLRKTMKDTPLFIYVFCLIYFFGTILLFPSSILTIISGFAFAWKWGFTKGFIYCMIFNFFGWHLGHTGAFTCGRYVFSGFIAKRMIRYKRFWVLNRAIDMHGAYIHFILRASFIIPYGFLSYALSITGITFR